MHFDWDSGVHGRATGMRLVAETHDDERALSRIAALLGEGRTWSITLHRYEADETFEEMSVLFGPAFGTTSGAE